MEGRSEGWEPWSLLSSSVGGGGKGERQRESKYDTLYLQAWSAVHVLADNGKSIQQHRTSHTHSNDYPKHNYVQVPARTCIHTNNRTSYTNMESEQYTDN